MSLTSVMNTALSGLYTSQSAMGVTAANITNVNTPGYVREVVRQESIINGASSTGVKVASIERVVDNFLKNSMLSTTGSASRYAVETAFHDRVQMLLGRPDSNTSLAGRLDSLLAKVGATTQDTSKLVLRQDAIAGIEDFANEISRLSSEVQNLRTEASNQISENVNTINSLLKQIDALNPMIIKEKVLGNATGGLEQQRDAALNKLSSLIDIRVQPQADGSSYVTTSTGTLLLGGARYELRYTAPGMVTSETSFSAITMHVVDPTTKQASPVGFPLDGSLSGGELMGLLNMRDKILPDMANELGRLAGTVANELNAVHNASSAYPPPASLIGKQTGMLGTDPHGFTGQTEFVVTDATGTVVNKVAINFSSYATLDDVVAAVNAGLGGSGTLSLTNGVMSLTANGAGNGVAMVDNPANPSKRGEVGFSHFFGMNDIVTSKVGTDYATGFTGTDPNGFTAGSTVSFDVLDGSNKLLTSYTLNIPAGNFNDILTDLNDINGLGKMMTFSLDASGQIKMTPKVGYESVTLNVKTDNSFRGGTGVTLSSLFGIGARYLADQATGLSVVSKIAKQPQRMALGQLSYGTAVGQSALSVSNNEGAKAFDALATKVIKFPATGSLAGTSVTIGQYNATILSSISLAADLTASRRTDTQALADDVGKRYQDYSGVNLDEEMSNMVIFQNSYNAAARIITTVREMYDALLNVV
ncbi:flagellar hook-associated protein FlgK [Govanella unica]|uniref:Flagellar hook-associated protein 1 n=1 Tax=Govanella unica TaxID=2975056 RepID=A0A9X3Z6D5_9PROT|nr:flagellar hook-associated protein FlgK [Govania unica]MDA5193021.1 flagellar hook-associated protein FlgK [Govania unica]